MEMFVCKDSDLLFPFFLNMPQCTCVQQFHYFTMFNNVCVVNVSCECHKISMRTSFRFQNKLIIMRRDFLERQELKGHDREIYSIVKERSKKKD